MRTLITGSSHSLFFSRFVGNPQLAEKRQFDHLVKIQTKGETDISFFPTHLIIKDIINSKYVENGMIKFSHPYFDFLKEFNDSNSLLILFTGQDEHHNLFIKENTIPYDFFHPSIVEVKHDRQFVATHIIYSLLQKEWENSHNIIKYISLICPHVKKFYIPPPPPISQKTFTIIKERKGDKNYKDINNLECPLIRLKVYEIYINLIAESCEENNIFFLPPNISNRDSNGFLLEKYTFDYTHAVPAYYETDLQFINNSII